MYPIAALVFCINPVHCLEVQPSFVGCFLGTAVKGGCDEYYFI